MDVAFSPTSLSRFKEHHDLILSGDWLLIVILLPGSRHGMALLIGFLFISRLKNKSSSGNEQETRWLAWQSVAQGVRHEVVVVVVAC